MKISTIILVMLSLPLPLLEADDSIANVVQSILPDGRICHVSKKANGEVSTFIEPPDGHAGTLECKVVDKDGKILQWYQSFLDSKGHEIMNIIRKNPGNNHSYGGVEYVSICTYNPDGNIDEEHDYNGDGSFRSHVVNVYSKETRKWIKADFYNVTGGYVGSQSTVPPETFLYGEKKR